MENQVDSKKIIINNGLLLAGISILLSLIIYATGNHLEPHWSVSLVSGLAFIAIIVLGVKKFKESNGGFLSFGQAVKIGVGIAIVSALVGSIYQYIFMNFIEPDYMTQLIEVQQQKWLDQGMSDEQIEASQEMMSKFSGPLMTAAMGIISSAIGGFIVSAIAGAVMKKSEEEQY
ncbi:DUF4199 domain-containing protein [Tenacibaculum sp. IB213877]|uniref:DUF4199 domain-containing protein n=1 Tax=Tenacibaculum sp. IB213877 TaxID=3097351 RepID=UPI002A5A140A|nr:DUF4199 domain-containing protein [Tenacibaculum sp. IB213877]MDY0779621.1 DUF4199 domain-containing protein [Tenacibaculum sp. IB213877]